MRKIKIWWVAGVVVAVAAGATVYAVRTRAGHEDPLPAAVRADLATRARDVIENGGLPGEGRLACAIRVLGADPPTVTAADQARSIYVWAMCSTVGTGVVSGMSVPVAVRLTSPPTAAMPGDGVLYGPDIERLFPKRLWDPVLDDGFAGELEPVMNARLEQLS